MTNNKCLPYVMYLDHSLCTCHARLCDLKPVHAGDRSRAFFPGQVEDVPFQKAGLSQATHKEQDEQVDSGKSSIQVQVQLFFPK